MKTKIRFSAVSLSLVLALTFLGKASYAAESEAVNILRQGLLGAGVGAVSAGVSGGKAGKGALIGAGTNVIGGALLNLLTSPSTTQTRAVSYPSYVEAAPQTTYVTSYAVPTPAYTAAVAPAPVYTTSAPDDSSKKVLRQGLLGAGVGAISASTSGGKAGQGALIGAGTNVIGGALMDTLFTSSTPAQPVYYQAPLKYSAAAPQNSTKHIIRKFDTAGRVISEEEYWS